MADKRTYADRKEYEYEYKKKNLKVFVFKLRRREDADLIKIYEEMPNKWDFIRDAIRAYAKEHGIEITEKTED